MSDPCVDDVIVFDRCHFAIVPVGKHSRNGVRVSDDRFERTEHMAVNVEQMRAKVEEKSGAGSISAVAPACHASLREPVPAIVLDAGVERGTDVARGNATTKLANAVVVSECESDLVNFAAVFCSFEHGGRIRIVDRERFFAEDMFAVIEGHDCLAGMCAIGACDCDCVDIRTGAEGIDVIGGVLDSECFGKSLRVLDVSPAYGDDFGVGMRENAGNVANFRKVAGTDDGNAEFVDAFHLMN